MTDLKQYAHAIVGYKRKTPTGVSHICVECFYILTEFSDAVSWDFEDEPIFANAAWNSDVTCDGCLERIH